MTGATDVAKFGIREGMVIQELGWDEDVDPELRNDIMDAIDADMIDEALEAVDAVLLWWRYDDGDIADGLVDALTDLNDTGFVLLVTPKVGREGYIDPADIAEGANIAGLALTSAMALEGDWQAQKVVRPKGFRR